MSLPTRLFPLIAAALLASPLVAAEGTDRLPLAARARPLTLPAGTIALEGALSIHRETTATGVLSETLSLGAAWAPSDDVELTVVALPLVLAPRVAYGAVTRAGFERDASAGVRWRFLRGGAQVGFGLRATFRGGDEVVFGVEPTIPAQLALGRGRLDASLGARVELRSPIQTELSLRLGYLFQVTPQLSLTASTGAVVYDLGRDARVPASISGAYAISGSRNAPLVDVSLSLEFERLFDASTGDVRVDVYTVAGAARFYVR